MNSLLGVFIVDISAGSSHTLALSDDQKVYGWGDGTNGQLGVNKTMISSDAVQVALPDIMKIVKISAGVAHSGAVTENN